VSANVCVKVASVTSGSVYHPPSHWAGPIAIPRYARILFVHAHKVLLDADLAALYGVSTKVLVQAVRRNIERFPLDFMFQLTEPELKILRSQIVTSRSRDAGKWGGRRTLPYAFSEQGALIDVMPAKPVPECCNRGAGIQRAAEIPGFPLARE